MTVPPSGDPYAPQPPSPSAQPGPAQPYQGAAPTTTADPGAAAPAAEPAYGAPSPYGPPAPYGAPAPHGAPAPYGEPSAYGTAGWGERAPLDGVSVAALVTGILTLGIVPLILGIAGIVRTKGGRRRGKGFAITGVVLGALSTIGWTLLVVGLTALFTSEEARTALSEGYAEGINEGLGTNLAIGECFDPPADITSGDPLAQVDCATPHTAETFVVHDITADAYPGEAGIDALVQEHCLTAFESYVGTPYEESTLDIFYFYPTDATWAIGDRRLLCGIVAYDGSMLEGSIAGSGR